VQGNWKIKWRPSTEGPVARHRDGDGLATLGRTVGLFAAGVLAAFLALWLYGIVLPGPHQLTARDVSDTVAQVMASATPPLANSALAYQVIAPSLVVIQTKGPGAANTATTASEAVLSWTTQAIYSPHCTVVTNATDIQLTFAGRDPIARGDHSAAARPRHRRSARRPSLRRRWCPPRWGTRNAMRVGDEAFVVGNPFGLYSSLSAGVISGFDRSFEPGKGHPQLTGSHSESMAR